MINPQNTWKSEKFTDPYSYLDFPNNERYQLKKSEQIYDLNINVKDKSKPNLIES